VKHIVFFLFSCFCGWVNARGADETRNSITLGQFNGKAALLLDIHLPAQATTAEFVEADLRIHQNQRVAAMIARDTCVKIDKTSVARSGVAFSANGQACDHTLKLAVILGEYPAIAMYSIARPMTNGGAIFYPAYFVARAKNSALSISILSDRITHIQGFGQIQTGGKPLNLTITEKQFVDSIAQQGSLALNTFVYVGPEGPHIVGQLASLRDKDVPDTLYALVTSSAEKVAQTLSAGFGMPIARRISLISRMNKSDNQTVDSLKGEIDSLGNIVLELPYVDPQRISALSQNITELISHEFVHLFNGSGIMLTDHRNPWLHEGGAEFLMIPTLMSMGQLTDEQLLKRVNYALTQCLNHVEKIVWPASDDQYQAQLAYRCGSIFHLIAWRQVQMRDARAKILPTWARYWRNLKVQTVDSFISFFDTPGLAASLQGKPNAPLLGPLLRSELERVGIAWIEVQPLANQDKFSVVLSNFRDLANPDCKSWGFRISERGVIEVSDNADCVSISKADRIVGVEGQDLFDDPIIAFEFARVACAKRKKVTVNRIDRSTFDLPCTADWTPSALIRQYEFKPKPLLEAFKQGV
jgi:hypothetical protein